MLGVDELKKNQYNFLTPQNEQMTNDLAFLELHIYEKHILQYNNKIFLVLIEVPIFLLFAISISHVTKVASYKHDTGGVYPSGVHFLAFLLEVYFT